MVKEVKVQSRRKKKAPNKTQGPSASNKQLHYQAAVILVHLNIIFPLPKIEHVGIFICDTLVYKGKYSLRIMCREDMMRKLFFQVSLVGNLQINNILDSYSSVNREFNILA